MANWDFVVTYDTQATDWLRKEGLPFPPIGACNRLPTTEEIGASWKKYDRDKVVLIDNFDWDNNTFCPADYFKIRGDWFVEFSILKDVCQKCGQLWMYPDTGSPAVIFDAAFDIERAVSLYTSLYNADDGWERFYRAMYDKS